MAGAGGYNNGRTGARESARSRELGGPAELRKIAEGREAEMFAWGDGTILRLLRDPGADRRNQMQAAAMRAAAASGLRVPAVVEVTTAMGRPGIVM